MSLNVRKHEWLLSKYAASPLTCGASGRGRTVAWERECRHCGRLESRYVDWKKNRTAWLMVARGQSRSATRCAHKWED